MIEHWVQRNGSRIFRIRVNDADRAQAAMMFDAIVDRVSAWAPGVNGEPSQFEPYLTARIKWDSCSTFTFGDDYGDLHICGVQDFLDHITLMQQLYQLAFETMTAKPQPGEEWPEQVSPATAWQQGYDAGVADEHRQQQQVTIAHAVNPYE